MSLALFFRLSSFLSFAKHRIEREAYTFNAHIFTTIPAGKYRFSSEHHSLSRLGAVSTWMGDHLGIDREAYSVEVHMFTIIRS